MDYYYIVIWFLLVFISSILSRILNLSSSLVELSIGIIFSIFFVLDIKEWVNFLASFGAIALTFLAGTELEFETLKKYSKESIILGFIGFLSPFLIVSLVAFYLLKWNFQQSILAGIALSTTSVAVVYSVMVETGLNETQLGKVILAACFVNDLATVIALSLLFTKINYLYVLFTLLPIFFIPYISKFYFKFVNNYPSEPDVKFIFFILILFSFLATLNKLEPVLPAYIIGASLANQFSNNKELSKRIRIITLSVLTPFYFLKAGILVKLKVVFTNLSIMLILFFAKVFSKILGLYPVAKLMKFSTKTNIYNTLMMSTGLTFGTISALYGLTHNIIDSNQYSLIVIAVILSALIPTLIAQIFFKINPYEANNFKIEKMLIKENINESKSLNDPKR